MAETNSCPHCFRKDGVWYFSRRVPRDLQGHYVSERISYSLRTKSRSVAASRAAGAAQRLDEYWYHLRLKSCDLPGRHLLKMAEATSNAQPVGSGVLAPTNNERVKLSEAVALYLRLKGRERPATFRRAAERACGYVIDACRDKDIGE